MRKSYLLAGVILGLASSEPAFAWGNDGHEVIALIARHIIDERNPEVAKRLDALLAGATDPQAAADFAGKARWADQYRDSSDDRREATSKWHFINLQIDGTDRDKACADSALAAGTPASKGTPRECVVRKINQFRRELSDPSVSAAEKKLAVLFLLHFVGDLHQPLHSADDHNFGGNGVSVVVGDAERGTNLHSYWDTNVVRRLGSTPGSIATMLIADLPQSLGTVPVGDERTYAWADEAHAVGREFGFQDLPSVKRTCTIKPFNKPPQRKSCFVISPEYATNATGKARLQLQRGGARLAAVLIEALK